MILTAIGCNAGCSNDPEIRNMVASNGVQTDCSLVRPITLVSWKEDRSSTRLGWSHGLASKHSAGTLYVGVLSDAISILLDRLDFAPGYWDESYGLIEERTKTTQFWKIDLGTGANSLITRAEWEDAGPRVRFTLSNVVAPHLLPLRRILTLTAAGRENAGRPRWITPDDRREEIPSRIQACLSFDLCSPTETLAFVGTLSTPLRHADDLCVEFMVRHDNAWHSLGVAQLAGTADLAYTDPDFGDQRGFVAKGTHWVSLFQDKLWIVPVPSNPFPLTPPPPAKPGRPAKPARPGRPPTLDGAPLPADPVVPGKPQSANPEAPEHRDIIVNSDSAVGAKSASGLGASNVYWYGQEGRNHSSIVDRQAALKTIESLRAADSLYGEFK